MKVGATYLDSGSGKEVGATLSSGGFSRNFMQAAWQAQGVEAYLTNPNVTMPAEAFYSRGRAYPDISAFGQDVKVYVGPGTRGAAGQCVCPCASLHSRASLHPRKRCTRRLTTCSTPPMLGTPRMMASAPV